MVTLGPVSICLVNAPSEEASSLTEAIKQPAYPKGEIHRQGVLLATSRDQRWVLTPAGRELEVWENFQPRPLSWVMAPLRDMWTTAWLVELDPTGYKVQFHEQGPLVDVSLIRPMTPRLPQTGWMT